MIRKPDAVFLVRICPVFRVHGCAEKKAQQDRGVFGCHMFTFCPNCVVVPEGYEAWGENGHMQAKLPTREAMQHWVKLLARRQWPMKHGPANAGKLMMGYRFARGGTLYYEGSWLP